MIKFVIFAILIALDHSTVADICTAPGKFPNDQVGSCEGYTLCLMAGAGNFAQYNLTCPAGFIYNHVFSQCTNDTSYQCVPDFTCTESGAFPHPLDDKCTTYIACVKGMNTIMTARSIACPVNQIFSPITDMCVDYNESVYKCYRDEKQSSNVAEVLINLLESTGSKSSSTCVQLPLFIITLFIIVNIMK